MMLRNGRDLKLAFGLGSNMVFPHQPGNPILTTEKPCALSSAVIRGLP